MHLVGDTGRPPDVGLVERFYALWNDSTLDAAPELFSPDAGSGIPPGWPQTGPVMEVVPVFGVRDGLIAHISGYETAAEAIAAAERIEPAAGA